MYVLTIYFQILIHSTFTMQKLALQRSANLLKFHNLKSGHSTPLTRQNPTHNIKTFFISSGAMSSTVGYRHKNNVFTKRNKVVIINTYIGTLKASLLAD